MASRTPFGALHGRPWSRHVGYLHPAAPPTASGPRQYGDALLRLSARPDEAVSLDVQLPFCPMQCLYCDGDVTVTHDPDETDRYLDALATEIDRVADRLGGTREVLQLHFGGRTPNYLSDEQLERAKAALDRRFRLLAETEFSIDCDPRRTSATQLDRIRALGFRRVAFGMADLQPEVQRAVGRMQSPALLEDACTMALAAGFEIVGIDFLHGLPDQTEIGLRATLQQIIDIAPDRITCNGYAHRPSARRHQCAIGAERLPGAEERDALFRVVAATLTNAGYTWIGLDLFVLDTDELALAHADRRLHCNVIGYTATPVSHVLGFGNGATGDVDDTVVCNEALQPTWQEMIAAGVFPVAYAHRRSPDEARRCNAIAHLLCNLELPARLVADGLEDAYARLRRLAADGLVAEDGDRIAVTPSGRFALDRLCAVLHPAATRDGSAEGVK